jgi:pyruvate/2-oxoglutarate/acetoin dehydrogenase E1 component
MGRELRFSRAENEALRQEMERDAAVVLLGEDVADRKSVV